MNSVILIGRLTKDVVLRKSQSGTVVAGFTLAVNKAKEGVDFIPCVAYNQTAELMGKYLSKGSKIAVQGRINTRNYDNDKGQKVYVTEVIVDRIEFLDSKKTGEGTEASQEKYDDFITDDSLPF